MRLLSLILISFFMFAGTSTFAYDSDAKKSNERTPLQLAGSPPGLQKKGFSGIPYSGKTPPGWSQGVKRGWNKDANWRWDKNRKTWENKNWRWDAKTDGWIKNKNWNKHRNH